MKWGLSPVFFLLCPISPIIFIYWSQDPFNTSSLPERAAPACYLNYNTPSKKSLWLRIHLSEKIPQVHNKESTVGWVIDSIPTKTEKSSWVLLSVCSFCTCTDCSTSVFRAQRLIEGSGLTTLLRSAGSGTPPGIHKQLFSYCWQRVGRGNPRTAQVERTLGFEIDDL